MLFVTRTEWGASTGPTSPADDLPTAHGVKVHWIGGDYTTPDHDQCAAEVRAILHEHLTNPHEGWVDIAYNALTCQHGYVFEGRGAGKRSGANGNAQLNTDDYAVCAIVGIHEPIRPELLNGLADAIDWLRANGAGDRVSGHCDGYNTDCPGPDLYRWAHAGAPRPDGGTTPPQPPATDFPAWPGRYLSLKSPRMTGEDVRTLQTKLLERGWYLGDTGPNDDGADGDFGPIMDNVVRQFQREKFADPKEWDGIVGEHTWNKVFTAPVTP